LLNQSRYYIILGMKNRLVYPLIIFILLAIVLGVIYTRFIFSSEKTAYMMGTTVRVKVNGRNAPYLARQALEEIKRLDTLFSRLKKNSEISKLNRGLRFTVSKDTVNVLKAAASIKQLSRGAFDVSFGGTIDLGGIGKGYAVESARRLLLKKGVKSAIIDAHSSIAVIGDDWRIGVKDPRGKQGLLGIVILNDGDALSTSAQYEQPDHIIDPRTGKPADKCLSVTVIARDAGLADAISTAVFVLGPDEGMKLTKKLSIKTIIVNRTGSIHDNFGFKLR